MNVLSCASIYFSIKNVATVCMKKERMKMEPGAMPGSLTTTGLIYSLELALPTLPTSPTEVNCFRSGSVASPRTPPTRLCGLMSTQQAGRHWSQGPMVLWEGIQSPGQWEASHNRLLNASLLSPQELVCAAEAPSGDMVPSSDDCSRIVLYGSLVVTERICG